MGKAVPRCRVPRAALGTAFLTRNAQRGTRNAQRGFTLLELLVALTLLAVIAGGMAMAFSTSLRAAGTIQDRAERLDARRALIARLKADLQGVWVRSGSETTWLRGFDAGSALNPAVGSESDVLDLTTARSISPESLLSDPTLEPTTRPQSDIAQVSWQLERDASGLVGLVRRERTPPDPELEITLDTTVVPIVIARGIADLNLRYFDGVDWWDEWEAGISATAGTGEEETEAAPAGLPRAVEVTLVLSDGAPRRSGEADEPRLTLVVALPGAEDATGTAVEVTIPGETTP